MLGVRCQARGQCSGGVVGLFRLSRIDHRDQQILKLWEKLLERLGALPPRQPRREHRVRIRRDAEMTCRVRSGEYRQNRARQDHGQGVALAEFDQADKEALKQHHEPERCRMGGRLGSRRLL
jgi:mRNA-degrading endonuclease RelE of RelBE toxin-antitoxin system